MAPKSSSPFAGSRVQVFSRDNLLPHSFCLDDLCSALGCLSNVLIDTPSLVLCLADSIFEEVGTAPVDIQSPVKRVPTFEVSLSLLANRGKDLALLTVLLCFHTFDGM